MEVTIYMADFAGHLYVYTYGYADDFGDRDLAEWVASQTNPQGLLPYDGGFINVSACSRIWYKTWDVH